MFAEIVVVGRIGLIKDVKKVDEDEVINFTLATEERYTNRKGERVTETTWWNVATWNASAKALQKHKEVGDVLLVRGSPKVKVKRDENGEVTNTYLNIHAGNIRYLPSFGPGGKAERDARRAKALSDTAQSQLDVAELANISPEKLAAIAKILS